MQLLAKEGNEAFEVNTDYKWMTCCGVFNFMLYGMLIIFFFASFIQNIGSRQSMVTYEDQSVDSFEIPFTNMAMPANFRINFDRTKVKGNMQDDLGTSSFSNADISKFLCANVEITFQNYFKNSKSNYEVNMVPFSCMRDQSYETYASQRFQNQQIFSVLLQVDESFI